MICIKRIYDPPKKKDGYRILVDRLWPRGLKKSDASMDQWAKEIAPSSALRKWFNHDPERWKDFKQKYTDELKQNHVAADLVEQVKAKKTITLLYAAHDEKHNHALVIQSFLNSGIKISRESEVLSQKP